MRVIVTQFGRRYNAFPPIPSVGNRDWRADKGRLLEGDSVLGCSGLRAIRFDVAASADLFPIAKTIRISDLRIHKASYIHFGLVSAGSRTSPSFKVRAVVFNKG